MVDSKVLACARCGQRNRVRAAAAGLPHCGKCGGAMPWMVEVGSGDFAAAVEQSPVPVLVDFWAPWCGPCRIVAPVVEQLANDLAGRLKVAKVNTDEQPDLGGRFGIRGIPTLVLIHRGSERDRVTGAMPGPALRQWVETRLEPGVR
ncbi:MAG TPA: thioredoxin [Candidatus Dormibacteraeota bacterium]|nr:thioredoxin [Candidatus Dormibacteraeota bacterium]